MAQGRLPGGAEVRSYPMACYPAGFFFRPLLSNLVCGFYRPGYQNLAGPWSTVSDRGFLPE